MGLEKIVQKVRNFGRRFFVGATLAGILSLGCTKEAIVNPRDNEPAGNPPAAPDFYQVVPLAQEPRRGMHLIIYDASSNEDGFRIERRKQAGTFTTLTNLPANTETYDDWGVDMSTSYTYRIRAYNQFGSSGWNEKTQTSAGPEPGTILIYPTADAYVEEAFPQQNFGSSSYLLVTGKPSRQQISYLKFPYNQIPSYAIDIDESELRLISQNEPAAGTPLVSVFDLAIDWNENNVTWNNKPFERGIAATDAEYVYNNGQPVYWDITHIVRSSFNRTTLNHGIELYVRNQSYRAVLYSRERSDLKPLLTIKYLW